MFLEKINVDIVLSIDCDELLTTNIVNNFDEFLNIYESKSMGLFWYNSVNNTLAQYRSDPQYASNFRTFVLPLKTYFITRYYTVEISHTPRVPHVTLQHSLSKEYGVLHLQAINTRFYALKQLWYKHHELVNYGHSVDLINSRYDSVVNQFNFQPEQIDPRLIEGITFDVSVFDGLEEDKGYLKFIKENYNEGLVTFGKEFL